MSEPKYTKMKLWFDKVSAFHEGYCSGNECEYEVQEKAKTKIIDIPLYLLGKYDEEGEIPVTDNLRMAYMFSYDRKRTHNVFTSGWCTTPPTEDERLLFAMSHEECNKDVYVLMRIELISKHLLVE